MVLEDLAIFFGDLAAWEALVSSCSFQGADNWNRCLPGFYNGISTAEVDTLAAETCATAVFVLGGR